MLFLTINAVNAENIEKKKELTYQTGSIDYTIKFGKLLSQRELMSFFVLPKQKVQITVEKNKTRISFAVSELNKTLSNSATIFNYTAASEIGYYDLIVRPNKETQSSVVRVFVMRPATEIKDGVLKGFRIGAYPQKRYKNKEIYNPPFGFVELTEKNQNIHVSPHYTLGQFMSKQGGKYPKYLALRTRLLRKLEYVTDLANAKGIRTDGFQIMSGFRTPYYNAAIKNTLYSRHQWGGAADIFVDENPKDNYMDDLNADGKINFEDAKYLAKLINERSSEEDYQLFVGGLGIYKANSAHGPFIHVDVRGTKARW